jgi:signal peptidase I
MTSSPKSEKTVEDFVASAKSFAKAGALALAIRFLLFSPFVIPSGSMIPTLLVGDYLFVSCFSFGYSKFTIPFGYLLPGMRGRILNFQTPKRGDVVVFRPPYNTKMDYVKRIVGVPGDTVQMKNGRLYLNGKQLPMREVGPYDKRADEGGVRVKGTLYDVTLPSGKIYRIVKQVPFGTNAYDNTPAYEVPEAGVRRYYFVMGDNWDGSSDSRATHAIGLIPEDHFVGKPLIIFFSTDGRARWWQVWGWFTATRFDRLGKLL